MLVRQFQNLAGVRMSERKSNFFGLKLKAWIEAQGRNPHQVAVDAKILPPPPVPQPARFVHKPPPPRPAAPTGPAEYWTHSQKTIAIQRAWEAREAERLYCQDGDGI